MRPYSLSFERNKESSKIRTARCSTFLNQMFCILKLTITYFSSRPLDITLSRRVANSDASACLADSIATPSS